MVSKSSKPRPNLADVPICSECGEQHLDMYGKVGCTEHATGGRTRPERRGKHCLQPTAVGLTICKNHGANDVARAVGKQRAVAAESAAVLVEIASTLGRPGDDRDPAEIVTEQIRWRHAHVQWLRQRVQKLDPKLLLWGMTKQKDGGDDAGTTYEAKPSAWYALYIDASRDLEKLCLDAIRAGLEVRRVRLEERRADALVTMLDGLLIALGLNPNDPKTAEIVATQLRSVA